jgi:hypothetical protein
MTDRRLDIGGNNPPQSPFEAVKVHIEDLYSEARNFLDGEPITSNAMAQAVESLLDQIREAEKAADAARKDENRPFDDGKAEVQARYAPLISDTKAVKGMTVRAIEACKAALAPWRQEQERMRQEEARKAREEADRKAAEAAALSRAADDLAARERAEQAVKEAEQAAKAASKADKAATTGTGLRPYFRPELVDGVEALRHYWKTRPDAMLAAAMALAKEDVQAGKRQIPGFLIVETRRAI